MADDSNDPSRPSFSEFWKKSKEALGGKKLRFVDSTPGQGAGSGSSGGGAQDAATTNNPPDKAQIRRAQVRKAQTEHRQRKANYVKKLEMDVARMREMIEDAERDTQALLDENKAMLAQIQQAVNNNTLSLSLDQGVSLLKDASEPQLSSDTRLNLLKEADHVTVSLGFDEVMNAPTFYISSSPSSTHSQLFPEETEKEPSPADDALPDLTPAQTQAAINFILALEHICRDHFHPSLYHPLPPPSTVHPTPLIGHQANGHTLMASSLALRSAPDHIFKAAHKSTNRLFPSPSLPSTTATTQDQGNNGNASSSPSSAPEPDLSWRATSLTLRAIHGLASSLNPNDQVELAPVQAWFELVARFGVAVLLAEGVLEALKKEFLGVVKCPHFGAVMERGAFESVVARVLGGGCAGGVASTGGGEGGV